MLTLAGMLSPEPATVGAAGYPEIFQVVMAAFDRGAIALEGSIFRGREAGRASLRSRFRPPRFMVDACLAAGAEWALQGSNGFPNEPEQLEPGNQRRTNASVSWLQQRRSGYTPRPGPSAATCASSAVHATLLELTHQFGGTSIQPIRKPHRRNRNPVEPLPRASSASRRIRRSDHRDHCGCRPRCRPSAAVTIGFGADLSAVPRARAAAVHAMANARCRFTSSSACVRRRSADACGT